MNELKYLYYWNKKILSKKTNCQLIWTSQYERNSLILSLHFLLETWNHIDKCSQNTGEIFWIYGGTQGPREGGKKGTLYHGPAGTVARESLRAHDQFSVIKPNIISVSQLSV